MCRSKFIHNFSSKALALCLFTFAAAGAARATVVLNNVTTTASSGPTVGTTIGSAFLTGSTALSLSDVVLIQSYSTSSTPNTDSYVAGETFSVSLRNADGTVGATVFSNFTVSDGGSTGSSAFQTEADVNVPFILLPNTGYYFSLTAPSSTTWSFAVNSTYANALGATFPASGNVAYKIIGATTTYFSASSGYTPQLIYVDANAVPEPSSLALLGLAGAGAFLLVRRARAAKVA